MQTGADLLAGLDEADSSAATSHKVLKVLDYLPQEMVQLEHREQPQELREYKAFRE